MVECRKAGRNESLFPGTRGVLPGQEGGGEEEDQTGRCAEGKLWVLYGILAYCGQMMS